MGKRIEHPTPSARGPGDALIVGEGTVVADRRPALKPSAPGTDSRLNHGHQGPHVKAHPCPLDGISQEQALRNAWVELLSGIPFQWFATLTFETNVHPEAALKRWRRFTNDLNRTLHGRRWMKKPGGGIFWVVGLERQKRGVVHFHALMGDVNDLNVVARRLEWMDRWHDMAGFARIEAIKSREDAIRYVTKYVIKDGEIEFSQNLGDWQRSDLFPAE